MDSFLFHRDSDQIWGAVRIAPNRTIGGETLRWVLRSLVRIIVDVRRQVGMLSV